MTRSGKQTKVKAVFWLTMTEKVGIVGISQNISSDAILIKSDLSINTATNVYKFVGSDKTEVEKFEKTVKLTGYKPGEMKGDSSTDYKSDSSFNTNSLSNISVSVPSSGSGYSFGSGTNKITIGGQTYYF